MKADLATTHGRVRGHWEIHCHQPDNRLENALRGAEAEVEDGPDNQGALDGSVGIELRATATPEERLACARWAPPARQPTG